MKKEKFDIDRLKRRIRFCLIPSAESEDLFDKAYAFAMNQVLQMIESIECEDKDLIHSIKSND